MNTLSYKTVSANKETATKEWVLVDADGQTLGRLASKVAMLIRGKYKTNLHSSRRLWRQCSCYQRRQNQFNWKKMD